MEVIKWANGNGQTIQLEKEEAKELQYLIEKALKGEDAESGFINTRIEIESE